ncbi:MAG TPA: hypothetical protein VKD90_10455 [Gemmataceae bacterium]|nr:hypothetical protein [Gemmataceae bacterium]
MDERDDYADPDSSAPWSPLLREGFLIGVVVAVGLVVYWLVETFCHRIRE